MASVKWSDHAMACMKEQAKYIAEQSQSKEIAWKWANDVFEAADRLADFPQMGHPLPEFPEAPYLEIFARKFFRVIYRIHGNTCFIVTVRRTSMLLDGSFLTELNDVS